MGNQAQVTAPKVRRLLRDRRIEAEWQTGPDQFVVLSVSGASRGRLTASLRRERREESHGMESRIFAPFQDIARLDSVPVARYSAKALEEFYGRALAHVETYRGDPENVVGRWFAEGTTA